MTIINLAGGPPGTAEQIAAELDRGWAARRDADSIVDLAGWAPRTAEQIAAELDRGWAARQDADAAIAHALAEQIARAVGDQVPGAREIAIREDTSHLPAHGHIDAIRDASGRDLMPPAGEWHDLDWAAEVDDAAWELHLVWAHRFAPDPDGVRRLRILR